MTTQTALTLGPRRAFFLPLVLLGALVLAGCPKRAPEVLPDEIRVTSSSPEFTAVARALQEPCNNPADFGRCGCFLDGIRTSCDVVIRCIELGFCTVAQSEPDGTRVTSESETFSAAVQSLLQPCNNPAEFGRCGCFMDGFRTSCDVAFRCLEAGFCVRVATDE